LGREFVVGVGETYDLPPTERDFSPISPNNADLDPVSPQGTVPSQGYYRPGVQILNHNLVASPVDAQIRLPKSKRAWRNSALQAKMRAAETTHPQKQSDPLQDYCGSELQQFSDKLGDSWQRLEQGHRGRRLMTAGPKWQSPFEKLRHCERARKRNLKQHETHNFERKP